MKMAHLSQFNKRNDSGKKVKNSNIPDHEEDEDFKIGTVKIQI